MPDARLIIHTGKKVFPGKRAFQSETPEDNRYGFWGMVTELHPENHTVHVRTSEGRIISNVKIASDVWVTIDEDKGFLSGRRYMPPVDTHVLVFMPNGQYSSAVIIASGFSDDSQHKGFMGDSDDEKEIDEFIKNSGWKYTEDNRTGTRILQNDTEEPTIKIEINQETEGEEKAKITIHGNSFTVDKDNGIKVETDKKIVSGAQEDIETNTAGEMNMTADGAMSFKGKKTELVEIGNAVATMGKMISDLLQACINFKSVGSPATHTAPDFTTAATAIKTQWDQVFK